MDIDSRYVNLKSAQFVRYFLNTDKTQKPIVLGKIVKTGLV